jgi:hypothetical protein
MNENTNIKNMEFPVDKRKIFKKIFTWTYLKKNSKTKIFIIYKFICFIIIDLLILYKQIHMVSIDILFPYSITLLFDIDP